MKTLNDVRLLLLGSWLGAAIFFSAAVAPAAFRTLRAFDISNATEIAGVIVGQTLYLVNIFGFAITLVLLIFGFRLKNSYSRRSFIFQIVLLAIVAFSTGAGEWIIARRMRAIRAMAPLPIDQLAATDPLRLAFDALHGYSVGALSVAIISGLIAFFVIANRARVE